MEGQSEISSVMKRFELSEDDLKIHQKAYYSLSHYGNKKAIDAIPQERRDRIARFYRALREEEILFYNPETGRSQERVGYYEGWVKILRNDPNKPEMQDIDVDQVRQLIKNGLDEVKKKMRFRDRARGDLGPIFKKALRENDPGTGKKGGRKEDGHSNRATAAQ